jgi:two-component system LytT family sensor kinase
MLRILRIILINSLFGILLFTYLYYSETKGKLVYLENIWLVASVIIGSNILGWGIIYVGKLLDRVYPWKRSIILRFSFELGLNFLLVIGILSLIFSLFSELLFKIGLSNLISQYSETTIRVFILTFVSLFFYTILDFALYSYNQYSVVQIESIRISRQQLELQFDALKSQLSPHYLFNNLNTIYSLVHQDQVRTEHYIRMMAQTYQYILNTHSQKEISIIEEIGFIEAYKYLLEIRFGSTLEINIKLTQDTLSYYIPPLSLQILIENAVKHNSFDEENPLRIEILNDYDDIIVRNNISLAKPKSDSLKIGLDNLRKRYSYLTTRKLQTIVNNYFIVRIPILKTISS